MPSLTPIELKRSPTIPFACTDRLTPAATSSRCMLHGLPSYQTEAMPTCGLFMPFSSFPTSVAYSCAWPAPCVRRCVITAEYWLGAPACSSLASTASNVPLPPALVGSDDDDRTGRRRAKRDARARRSMLEAA